jgi:UPF0716 protein FxsA
VILLLLFLAFTLLPVVELILLLRIGQAIDWPATVGLVLFTGAVGAALARWQGVKVLGEIREQMATGQLPGRALFDGALILVAGAVLITPGVITDAFGFLLLVPFVRTLIGKGLRRYAQGRVNVTLDGFGVPPGMDAGFGVPPVAGPQAYRDVPAGGDVIDVEARPAAPSGEEPPLLPS